MFSEAKVTQMAAYLLHKCGGRTEHIKIIKLMYLADRVSFARRGIPMSDDKMVSMPHGPVLSQTYDLMKAPSESEWDKWIAGEAGYQISLKRVVDPEDEDQLLDLSMAEIRMMDEVIERFGSMTWQQLVSYTHDHCDEWSDPNGSSHQITPYEVFRALGKDHETAKAAHSGVIARRQLQEGMAAYL